MIFVQPHKRFLQRHRSLGIIARLRHVLHAVAIRFELGAASVFHQDHLRSDIRSADSHSAVVAVACRYGGTDDAGLQDHGPRLLPGRMARCCVHRLMAQHGCQLGLRLQLDEQASIYRYLATGQSPGIRYGIVQDDEFVGQIDAALCCHAGTHALHVGCEIRVDIEGTALGLLHRHIVLSTDRKFLLRADGHELASTGNRVDGTASNPR